MTSVFVTGGTGFVGRRLADMLVEQGHEVKVIARPTSDTGHLESLGVSIVRGDLYDVAFLAKAMKGCQQLHHVASLVDNGWARPEDYYRSNVTATRAVFEAAREAEIGDAVYTSSIAVFGTQPKGSIIAEDTQPRYGFLHPYGHSKYLGEIEALSHAGSGTRVMATNPPLIFGIGDRNVPPDITRFILGEEIAPIDPEVHIPIVHVDDVARGQILAMERGTSGERYLISAETLTAVAFYGIIAEALGYQPPQTAHTSTDSPIEAFQGSGFPDSPPGFAGRPIVNNAKSRTELGLEYMPVPPSLAATARAIKADFPVQVNELPRNTLI